MTRAETEYLKAIEAETKIVSLWVQGRGLQVPLDEIFVQRHIQIRPVSWHTAVGLVEIVSDDDLPDKRPPTPPRDEFLSFDDPVTIEPLRGLPSGTWFGPVGIGATTLLRWLAGSMTRGRTDVPSRLPLLISTADFVDTVDAGRLPEVLARRYRMDHQFFEVALRRGGCVILFDAGRPTGPAQTIESHLSQAYVNRDAPSNIVFTIFESLGGMHDQETSLAPFTASEVAEYLARWQKLVGTTLSPDVRKAILVSRLAKCPLYLEWMLGSLIATDRRGDLLRRILHDSADRRVFAGLALDWEGRGVESASIEPTERLERQDILVRSPAGTWAFRSPLIRDALLAAAPPAWHSVLLSHNPVAMRLVGLFADAETPSPTELLPFDMPYETGLYRNHLTAGWMLCDWAPGHLPADAASIVKTLMDTWSASWEGTLQDALQDVLVELAQSIAEDVIIGPLVDGHISDKQSWSLISLLPRKLFLGPSRLRGMMGLLSHYPLGTQWFKDAPPGTADAILAAMDGAPQTVRTLGVSALGVLPPSKDDTRIVGVLRDLLWDPTLGPTAGQSLVERKCESTLQRQIRLGLRDPGRRLAALKLIVGTGQKMPWAMLQPCLADGREDVKVAAIAALGLCPDPRAIGHLSFLLDGPASDRMAALSALWYLGFVRPHRALPATLARQLIRIGTETPKVRGQLMDTFSVLGVKPPLRPILEWSRDPDPRVRRCAPQALALVDSPEAVIRIAEMRSDPHWAVQDAAQIFDVHVRPQTRRILRQRLPSLSASTRHQVERLLEMAQDAAQPTPRGGIVVIDETPQSKRLSDVESWQQAHREDKLQAATQDPDPEVAAAAYQALVELHPERIDDLSRLATDPRPPVRALAATSLACKGQAAVLATLAHDRAAEVRVAIARALKRMAAGLPILLSMLLDTEVAGTVRDSLVGQLALRAASVETIATLLPQVDALRVLLVANLAPASPVRRRLEELAVDPTTRDTVQNVLADTLWSECCTCLRIFYRMPDPQLMVVVHSHAEAFPHEPDVAAAWALARLAPDSPLRSELTARVSMDLPAFWTSRLHDPELRELAWRELDRLIYPESTLHLET